MMETGPWLLLGDLISGPATNYRGTHRLDPDYKSDLPVDSPINQLWMDATDIMFVGRFVSAADSRHVQTVYAEAGFYFDLIHVREGESGSGTDDDAAFIGHDICDPGGYSLLSWNLDFEHPAPEFWHQCENSAYQPLLLLIQRYFRPRLNDYGLFSTAEDADFFLSAANALASGFDAVLESEGHPPFLVFSLSMIRSREEMRRQFAGKTS